MKALVSGYFIISIAFVLLSSMPCYAQVETQRFFTPEGTRWKLDDSCYFEFMDSLLITEIGFFSDRIWLWNDNSDSYFVFNARYKNRLISKFSGYVELHVVDSFGASGYVIPFLKYGKLALGYSYVCPPWGSACSNIQMFLFPLPIFYSFPSQTLPSLLLKANTKKNARQFRESRI